MNFYKIFYDLKNPVATMQFSKEEKAENSSKNVDYRNEKMLEFYNIAIDKFNKIDNSKVRRQSISSFCASELSKIFPNEDHQEYCERKVFAWNCQNTFKRKLLFERKACFVKNKWNFFVTFTYDSKIFIDEEAFRHSLKKTLSNFHTRRGWNYMLCFERAPITGRLHAHGLLQVPDGQMVGSIEKRTDYNFKSERRTDIFCNTFFESHFGRNDFESISMSDFRSGANIGYIEYILKYITKSNEKVFYSRGVYWFIIKELGTEAICCTYDYLSSMIGAVTKYVLHDSWETRHEDCLENIRSICEIVS